MATAGCTGSGRSLYQTDLGRAPSEDVLLGVAESVLRSYGFQTAVMTTRSLETEWREEQTSDVLLRSTHSRRDRVRVEVAARGGRLYVGRLVVIHEQRNDEGEWVQHPPGPAQKSEYDALRRDVLQRLNRYMNQR